MPTFNVTSEFLTALAEEDRDEWRRLKFGEFIEGEKEMGDGDDYTGKPVPGASESFGISQDASGHTELPPIKTVKNAWQIDVEKFFCPRKPSEAELNDVRQLRRRYLKLAEEILDRCPANPDRTHAIRQLKETMQTAISSIVCSETWDDIPGPKGD